MVLTTGAVSSLVIPFASLFSGPFSLPIQEPTSPEITSPPIKEDIADPPFVPTVLNLGNGPCLVAYPMGAPDLEQVMAVALEIARDGAIPLLQLQFSCAKYHELTPWPTTRWCWDSTFKRSCLYKQLLSSLGPVATYQQWIHSLFSLVSDNQRNSVTSQTRLVNSIERINQYIPEYVRESLHKFHQLEQPWQTQVDSILNAYLINFKRLVQQLNVFSTYSFGQLQQVSDLSAKGLCELSEEFDQERVVTAAAFFKLQNQANELSMTKPKSLPSPPSDNLADREQKLWEAI
ncbi:hypothetical protein DSO57_1029362 [Entomophthora muscae]|uniref:Uncharacterized protein n=1 Tax=Entomophthora muscae TaxID=34485 RepID=A0ACC2RG04_9FUNG|nr:hypothetical protein DSO57_1029362 [Entomophthora muscae]